MGVRDACGPLDCRPRRLDSYTIRRRNREPPWRRRGGHREVRVSGRQLLVPTERTSARRRFTSPWDSELTYDSDVCTVGVARRCACSECTTPSGSRDAAVRHGGVGPRRVVGCRIGHQGRAREKGRRWVRGFVRQVQGRRMRAEDALALCVKAERRTNSPPASSYVPPASCSARCRWHALPHILLLRGV